MRHRYLEHEATGSSLAALRVMEKQMWPDRRLTDLFGIEHPIIQAPMAGPSTPELAAAVSNAGGLGSLAFAMLGPDQANAEIARLRTLSNTVFNVNFFCHRSPLQGVEAEARWRSRLAPYYQQF